MKSADRTVVVMLIALAVAAFVAALIAFYSVMVRTASLVEADESGIPEPVPSEAFEEELPKAA